MKNWQFRTLLIVQILGFVIVIAITQGTNSFMRQIPKIYENTNILNEEDINEIKGNTEMIQIKVNLIQKMIENNLL